MEASVDDSSKGNEKINESSTVMTKSDSLHLSTNEAQTTTDSSDKTEASSSEPKIDTESDHKYEVIDGEYHYTDEVTSIRYRFDNGSQSWVALSEKETQEKQTESVHVDSDGRTYYYSGDQYLCQDSTGAVYYMNKENEWVLWDSKDNNNKNESNSIDEGKWYFYRGDEAFYRDQLTNVVYKFNKTSSSWEVSKSDKKYTKRKRKSQNPEEEFDTSESSEDENVPEKSATEKDELLSSGKAPPGYKNDPAISYDGTVYLKEDKTDNMLYEWDAMRRAWFPKIDEDFMARYQMSYGFKPDGSKDENPVKYDDDEEDEEAEMEKMKELERKKLEEKQKKKPGWFQADDQHNTKVYVSNLPEETSLQQFVDLMQKCGLVLKNPESGEYKVKMYKDGQGNFKGDALCTYIKVESVDLALQILDGYCVGPRNQKIKVERAKFQMKGEYNAALKPKKKNKKALDKLQKKQEKLFAWTPEPLRGQRGKFDNVAIIRNAFSPQEFEEHAEKILTHQETFTAQCSSFGAVKKVEVFDRHKEGIVKVTFNEPEGADLCIASMNGRLYCQRKLSVAVWDGAEKFKVEETPEEKAARLKKWDEYLTNSDTSDKT